MNDDGLDRTGADAGDGSDASDGAGASERRRLSRAHGADGWATRPVGEAEAPLEMVLARARALVGLELGAIADALGLPVPRGAAQTKGWSGQILEQELGVEVGGTKGPDFAALGLELKTVPVDEQGRPRESTAVCQIDPVAIAAESWDTSYVKAKLARVLFVALTVPDGARSVGERRVAAVASWRPSPGEAALLKADFELFVRSYFRKGRVDEITGHLGRVLQVRPKGKNSQDTRAGYDAEGRPIRVGKCGFYLRPAFVAAILRGEDASLSTFR